MLDSLRIKNFRCFEDLQIESLGRVNLIVGKNNTGKSTLLEAINLFNHSYSHPKLAIDNIESLLSKRNSFYSLGTSSSPTHKLLGILHHFEIDDNLTHTTEFESLSNRINIHFNFNNRTVEITNFFKKKEKTITNSVAFDEIDENYQPIIKNNTRNTNGYIFKVNKFRFYSSFNNISSVPTGIIHEEKLSLIWDQMISDLPEEELLQGLRILLPTLANIYFIRDENEERIAILKFKNTKGSTPLKAMGEGTSRLLQIFLYAYQAKGGYLLIDEFENGLHYSIQEEVWEKLFKLAEELDIQVFATTHSKDTLEAFSKVSLRSEEEGRIISLGRSAAKSEPGKIFATTLDEDSIELITETGMEVR